MKPRRIIKKILCKIETEIKLINDNIDKIYIDKLNRKISEEMYVRLFEKLKSKISEKENEYIQIKNEKENNTYNNPEKIKNLLNEFLKIEKPTQELMKVIISKIEIHQNKQIDIYLNFKKPKENCLL